MKFFFKTAASALALAITCNLAAEELRVFAASSLTDALKEIAPLFEKQNPGTKVVLNFGASGALLAQIGAGAPADVFASADAATMDRAVAAGFVAQDARRDFVSNTLVLITPAGSKNKPGALSDLTAPEYRRIAVGLPKSVPAGHQAQLALGKAGLWTTLRPKIVGAHNVRQALDYVSRGEADAGFVYATDTAIMKGKVRTAFVVPTQEPILYPVAPIKTSGQPLTAKRFGDFLTGEEAGAIFSRQGFGRP